jgi:tRNA(Glu) U13 pseudouridine synthase TruD
MFLQQKDRFEKVSVQENLFNRINQKRIDERDLSEVLEIDVCKNFKSFQHVA